MTDGSQQTPRAGRRRLDRISLERAANVVIVLGLVLCVAVLVNAVLSAYQDKVYGDQFFGPGTSLRFWQRVQYFLQATVNFLPWAVLVVAAGFALRAHAGRIPPAPAAAKADRRRVELPDAEPFPDATLFLPPPQPVRRDGEVAGSVAGDVVFAKPDDELWRS